MVPVRDELESLTLSVGVTHESRVTPTLLAKIPGLQGWDDVNPLGL